MDNELIERRLSIGGVPFELNTDGMCAAPSLNPILDLLTLSQALNVLDRDVMAEAMLLLDEDSRVRDCGLRDEAMVDTDALIFVTDWKALRSSVLDLLKPQSWLLLIEVVRDSYDLVFVRAQCVEHSGVALCSCAV